MATNKITMASLKRDVAALNAQVEKLTKELAQANSLKEMYSKNSSEYQQEIAAVHDLLDVLPGAIAKRKEETYSEHKLMTRLASFLAYRSSNQQF